MGYFNYTDEEKDINKVLKYNQEVSNSLLEDNNLKDIRAKADDCISSSEELLKSLGYGKKITKIKDETIKKAQSQKFNNKPIIEDWNKIVFEANQYIPNEVEIEDILTTSEIKSVMDNYDRISDEFSRKTSIINKTDLSFLAIATALQVTKSLVFPLIAKKAGYGDGFDTKDRLAHNDKSIVRAQREANDNFRDNFQRTHKNGYWINLLYQTPPYDITRGSHDLNINMEGKYHRLHTLGHDPVLGWIFGTADILTDIITMNDFRSFRVTRNPMIITNHQVGLTTLFQESYWTIRDDYLNLPAAIFAEAQHLKSDAYTKCGLPVPILEVVNENFASELYKKQYDSLCFARDVKIVGSSYLVSLMIDIIISLTHGIFRPSEEDKKLFEVRTRKILLISNAIASTSSIINASITKNPKNLDIGSLLSTISHLFLDIRFITKIKHEFIQNEIDSQLRKELNELDEIYKELQ